jgi:hypothetical protein
MKAATFGYQTPNLGDDLQAMAAAAHLPYIDTLLNRDALDQARLSEPHTCVMSSWFLVKNYRKAPVPALAPVFFGFCLGHDELLDYEWRDYLKRHAPIGCRDQRTVTRLQAAGIEAFFTGCMTLFMGRQFEPVPESERQGVLFVDVPDCVIEKQLPEQLRQQARVLTNYTTRAMFNDPIARMARMAEICDELRHAKLVVTSRLHTLLPCVGFNTPAVVFVEDDPKTRNRFSGYDAFLPVFYHKDGAVDAAIDWDKLRVPPLPLEIEGHYAALRQTLRQRLGADLPAPRPNVASQLTLRIPSGFSAANASRVQIDMGIAASRRSVSLQGTTATCTFPAFDMLRRFRVGVSLKTAWYSTAKPIGQLNDLVTEA